MGNGFRPVFLKLSGRKYLEQLRGLKERYVSFDDTWFSRIPEVALPERMQKWPEDFVLRAVINAIEEKTSLSIYYMSLTKTALRTIAPHALVFDGIRWHARAWCFKNEQYRDFVLGRIKSLGSEQDIVRAPDLPDDTGWLHLIKIDICPHPELGEDQRAAIAHDFLMEDGQRTVELRACLAFYFVRRFNLDLRNGEISPQRSQIAMRDYDEYAEAMRAIGMTP
jgi:hypothetical protein